MKLTVIKPSYVLALVSAVFVVGACGSSASDSASSPLVPDGQDPASESTGPNGDGKFEAWNSANNPAYVDPSFNYAVSALPLEGKGPAPIPGDYWAVARDGLNAKWDGSDSLSPAEKYEKAFGKEKGSVQRAVSEANGVLSQMHLKSCSTDADCADLNDGSICGSYKDKDTEAHRCIPTWFGICHGWAPYAISEPAARKPVVRKAADGTEITFYPGDLEGLMSLMYTEVPTKFLSQRCNKTAGHTDPRRATTTDSHGRVVEGECRDMNPGSFFVVTTNMMGMRKKGFVIDATYDAQVWNQPGYSYRIANAVEGKVPEITKGEAAAKLGANMQMSEVLATTDVKKDETRTGEFTAPVDTEYTIKLTGAGDADLEIKKGDQSVCTSAGGTSDEECKVTLKAGEVISWIVKGYSDTSKVQLGIGRPQDNAVYEYNPNATRFFYVEMDFAYGVEARPARTSNIDNFERFLETHRYTFILEADNAGKVIGGEWTGESRTKHPDFAWWPTGTPAPAKASGLIEYKVLKQLNDEAAKQ